MLTHPLKIDSLIFPNRVFLAPMSGVSDLPFRRLAYQAGAGLVISEMIASAQLCQGSVESQRRLLSQDQGVCVVQLAGYDPYWMARAAQFATAQGANMIDINMGCPAKKVTGHLCGAALMRDLDQAAFLIEAVVKAVNIPVSVKMRLGWDAHELQAPQLAKYAQEAGAAMITVHGRTRQQFYEGKANWSAIYQVREQITIPLVANGDVQNRQDAEELMRQSGADAVMIGRATYGQPWLCGQIIGQKKPDDLPAYILDHYEAMLMHYGHVKGARHARKHLDWYLQKHAEGQYTIDERQDLLQSTQPDFVRTLLQEIWQRSV